jgi:hypothetical protein
MEKDGTNIWIRDKKTVNKAFSTTIKQCCGSGMFFPIPDPTFFHPGSEFVPSRIPDPNLFHPGSKEFKYFNPKNGF